MRRLALVASLLAACVAVPLSAYASGADCRGAYALGSTISAVPSRQDVIGTRWSAYAVRGGATFPNIGWIYATKSGASYFEYEGATARIADRSAASILHAYQKLARLLGPHSTDGAWNAIASGQASLLLVPCHERTH